MENLHYKKKYLKYKEKYLQYKNKILSGGLVNTYPIDLIDDAKNEIETPQNILEIIDYLKFPNSHLIRVGSSNLKAFEVSADLDNMVFFNLPNDNAYTVITKFITHLKNLITTVCGKNDEVYFSDFKANNYHWSPEEILAEKNKHGEPLSFAISQKNIVKVDIIAPLNGRYIEASAFYILKSKEGYINITDDYFKQFANSLLVDIQEYKITKPFKAVKRTWSLGRLKKNESILRCLLPLVRSSVAKLAVINADLETLILLLEHNNKLNIDFILDEVSNFKERLSSLIDLKIDTDKTSIAINNIILLFQNYKTVNNEENKKNLIHNIKYFHNYLLSVINSETTEYLEYIKFTFPNNDTTLENSFTAELND